MAQLHELSAGCKNLISREPAIALRRPSDLRYNRAWSGFRKKTKNKVSREAVKRGFSP